jgi:hypothetical protein
MTISPYLSYPDRSLVAYLGEEFAGHCLKSIPTPEFLSHLRHFDLSHVLPTGSWSEIFVEIFDTVHANSQISKFFVWLQRQVSHENVLS